MSEDRAYKAADHAFRMRDVYAWSKYQLTADWLRGRSGTLANIGCGSGEFNATAAALGFNIIACEPDPAAYAIANDSKPARCEIFNTGVDGFVQLRRSADCIVMHDVLEHIEDDRRALAHLRAVCKPGGVMVLSVPAGQWLFGHHDEKLGHYRRYDKRMLAHAASGLWRIRRMRYFGLSFVPLTLAYSRLLRRDYPTGAAEKDGIMRSTMDLLCRLERRIAAPFGTSLIAELVPA